MKKKIIKKYVWFITPSEKEIFLDYCLRHHITFKELAEQLGIEKSHLSNILNGHIPVSVKKVLLFKEKLGIELEYGDFK